MSKIKKAYLLIVLAFLISTNLLAQANYDERYQRGKDYYKNKLYEMALEEFRVAARPDTGNPFAVHASFYYALCKYRQDEVGEAKAMLMQIKEKYPDWGQLEEVDYWLAVIDFEQGKLFSALDRLNGSDIDAQDAATLKEYFLMQVDSIPVLQQYLEANPYDTTMARVLAAKMVEKPLQERNLQWVDFLVREFGIPPQFFGLPAEEKEVKKEEYRVAVMLPFMYRQLDANPRKKSNQFVLDLYNGIKLAVEELEKNGVKVKLFAFDTERDSTVTAGILNREEMKGMDMIIGPLFPKPTSLMTGFSQENKIPMINPLSTNSSIFGNNPYAYLYRSTAETQARAAARFAATNFDNKNAFIVYSLNERDLVFAEVYAEELTRYGFNVNWYYQVVDAADARIVLEKLTEVFDVEANKLKGEDRVVMYNPRKVRVGEGDSLIISRDSIGHIMVSSRDNLLVANIMSALQSRADSIPLIGFDEWLEIDQLSFDQFQKVNISMMAFNFADFTSPEYVDYKKDYIQKYASLPTQFSFHGYEMMWFFGRVMGEYGKYFGGKLRRHGPWKGRLFTGFDYSLSNDNQVMPIVELDNYEMVLVKPKELKEGLDDNNEE